MEFLVRLAKPVLPGDAKKSRIVVVGQENPVSEQFCVRTKIEFPSEIRLGRDLRGSFPALERALRIARSCYAGLGRQSMMGAERET